MDNEAKSVMGFMAFILDIALLLTLACFLGFHVNMVLVNEASG